MENQELASKKPQQENIFVSLAFNLILPVFILQKGSKLLGGFDGASTISLAVALCFPLFYGLNDYFRRNNKNLISILGFFNTLLTGVFALATLQGHWFAIKEAAVPLLLGFAVLGSIKLKKPFMEFLILKSGVVNASLLKDRIAERGNDAKFKKQINKSTYLLSVSFFISSVLNYFLAIYIFVPLDSTFTSEQQKETLNSQIAQMNWMGMVVISLPLMFFLGFILWDFFRQVKTLSGLNLEELAQV